MNGKAAKFLIVSSVLMLIAALSPLMLSQGRANVEPPDSYSSNQTDLFTPAVWKPAWIDQNNNGIADSLDREIADRIVNGTAQDYVNVTVMLKATPKTHDTDTFAAAGG